MELEREKDDELSLAIIATREAHHHPVAIFDHGEVGDRLTDLTAQALPQLVHLELIALRTARARR